MSRPFFVLIFVMMASGAAAQGPAPLSVGDPFPRLESDFLTGRRAVLPDAARGKFALVMMGFTYDSRFEVEEWSKAFREAFRDRDDVTFFQVPVIGGMGRVAKPFIDSGMRKGTPKAFHENVITVYGGVDRWKRVVGFSRAAEHAAYLVLLDADGRVRWLSRGPCTADALAQVRAAIAP